jgi:hypothetical protein
MPWNAGVYGTHARRAPSARNTGGGGGWSTREVDDADDADDTDDVWWWSRSRLRRRSSSVLALTLLPERPRFILYAGKPGSQNCTGGNGGAGGTTASSCAWPSLPLPPSSRSPCSDAIVDVKAPGTLYDVPRGMTGIGSGDDVREGLPSDAAPPLMRKGTHERLGASTGFGFGAGTGSGGVSRRECESRCRLDPCEGVGEVNPGEGRRDL